MAQITCVVEFADGTRCTRRRKYASGWCANCDGWSRRNEGKDPNGRTPYGRVLAETCTVTFANGMRCDQPARYAPGWCVNCWKWCRQYGDPEGRPHYRSNGEALAEVRRAAADASPAPCLIVEGLAYRWTIQYRGKQIHAARAVWIEANGRDPGDAHVLHTCHQGHLGCIRLAHLYAGDHARNMADMAEAGRSTTANRGEGSPVHIHSLEQVRTIRERYMLGACYPHPGSARALAEELQMTPRYVWMLATGKRWAWLDAVDDQGHTTT